MTMAVDNPTAQALAKMATEQAVERARQMDASGATEPRWYIWQVIRASDQQAIETFARWKIPTYYPRILQLRVVPRRNMSASQRGAGVTVQRPQETPMFPRYLFTRIDLRRPDWHDIVEVAGVGGLICKDSMPVYMPDDVVASIKRRENNGVVPGKDSVRVVFGVGDKVVVTSGPFASFQGTVEQGLDVPIEKLEPSMRIKVAVDIFGRQTPVQLEHWQVAKDA